jgi:hypothetical protein
MKALQPNETVLTGSWIDEGGSIKGDDICQRIEWLIKSHLKCLVKDSTGWDTLYRDPVDNRLWERTYPNGDWHGGGPPQLNVVSKEQASAKYNIPD